MDSRDRRIVALLLVLLCVGVPSGRWLYAWLSAPRVPKFDLTTVDPVAAKAIEQMASEVRRRPRDGRAWGDLGRLLYAHDRFDESRLCFQQAEILDPSEPRWTYLQIPNFGNADPEVVRPILLATLPKLGGEPAPLFRLTELELDAGELEMAEQHLKRLESLAPENPRTLLDKGRLAAARRRWSEARESLRRSAVLEPRCRQTHALLWRACTLLGDEVGAASARRQLDEHRHAFYWVDRYFAEIMDFGVGLNARLLWVSSLLDQGEMTHARRLANQTVEEHPKAVQAYITLSAVELRSGDAIAAEAAARKAVSLDSTSHAAQHMLGASLLAQQRFAEALPYLEKSAQELPTSASMHFDHAACLVGLGRREQAITVLQTSLQIRPDFRRAHELMAGLLRENGDAVGAERHRRLAQTPMLTP